MIRILKRNISAVILLKCNLYNVNVQKLSAILLTRECFRCFTHANYIIVFCFQQNFLDQLNCQKRSNVLMFCILILVIMKKKTS